MKLLLATGNLHKARELGALLATRCQDSSWHPALDILTLRDFPDLPAVVEDGRTLEENAVKKALQPALTAKVWTLSDDTGLEVDALGGRPGVFSARYAGPECDFAANCGKLLRELSGVPMPRRGAVFRTVMALASPDGLVQYREGRLAGRIAESGRGSNGFGYDPVFLLPDEGRTLAELSDEEKNALSHRSLALRAVLPLLKEVVA